MNDPLRTRGAAPRNRKLGWKRKQSLKNWLFKSLVRSPPPLFLSKADKPHYETPASTPAYRLTSPTARRSQLRKATPSPSPPLRPSRTHLILLGRPRSTTAHTSSKAFHPRTTKTVALTSLTLTRRGPMPPGRYPICNHAAPDRAMISTHTQTAQITHRGVCYALDYARRICEDGAGWRFGAARMLRVRNSGRHNEGRGGCVRCRCEQPAVRRVSVSSAAG